MVLVHRSEVDTEGRIEGGFVTYDQGELLRYFAKRHRKGEQLRLLKISLTQTGLLGKEDNVGFVYVLNRTARDLEPGLGGPARIASARCYQLHEPPHLRLAHGYEGRR